MDSFSPTPETYTTRAYSSGDLKSVLRIAEIQLGSGYINDQLLTQICNSTKDFVNVVEIDDEIAGFVIGLIRTPGDIQNIMRVPLPDSLLTIREVGLLKTIAVSPQWTGRGVGTVLTESAMVWFHSRAISEV